MQRETRIATFAIKVKLCETHMRESLKFTGRHCYIRCVSRFAHNYIHLSIIKFNLSHLSPTLESFFYHLSADIVLFKKKKKSCFIQKPSPLFTSTPLSFRHCLKSSN